MRHEGSEGMQVDCEQLRGGCSVQCLKLYKGDTASPPVTSIDGGNVIPGLDRPGGSSWIPLHLFGGADGAWSRIRLVLTET